MMTLSKIAQLAHVSVSTASKAFSMSSEVSEETRNHVFAVARKYGCLRKFYKQEFYVPVVAVVCPEVSGAYAEILSYICHNLSENGCFASITTTDFSAYKKRQILDFYSRYSKVDAMIMIEHTGFPEMPNISFFPFDYQVALTIGTDVLRQEGVRDIALVGWEKSDLPEAGAHHRLMTLDDFYTIVGGKNQNLPEAVICRNESLALRLIRHLENRGIKVPEQVKVIGMGCSDGEPYGRSELTTIDFRIEENCETVVDQILKQMDGEEVGELSLLPPKLVKRKTA